MLDTELGPRPFLPPQAFFEHDPLMFCPGYGIDYARLYASHYGAMPQNWLAGHTAGIYIGYSLDADLRAQASSGGVMTEVMRYLLAEKEVDAVILARQGMPEPHLARAVVIDQVEDLLGCAQSIYYPVSMLDILRELDPRKAYAISLLPDAAATLRKLQAARIPEALAVKYVLGPYTGTQLYPGALRYFYRALGIREAHQLQYIKWRAGEWPGYLKMKSKAGKTVCSKKIYYNFLIPFYITQSSLLSIDFCNEFTDLSVGDAWSPQYEDIGQGFSVLLARSPELHRILLKMQAEGRLSLQSRAWDEAGRMHGHMLDFKKRGAFIRIRVRRLLGLPYPKYSLAPQKIGFVRILVELVNISLFAVAGTPLARHLLNYLPEPVLGPIFNFARLRWKAFSKPSKRQGLNEYRMQKKTVEPYGNLG